MLKYCFFILIALASFLEAKVNIFAHYFGQPEFIKYQHMFFEKNMLDDYRFVIVEDSRDPAISKQIKKECKKYGIDFVHIPRSVFKEAARFIKDDYVGAGSPSFECCVATNYIYQNYVVPSQEICMILDNDIFLLSPFSIEGYLAENSFAYVGQERGEMANRISYMLPNFLIFNPLILPEKERLNFNMGAVEGNNTDSGGYSYYYLKDYYSLGKGVGVYYLPLTNSDFRKRFLDKCPLMFTSKAWSSHYFCCPDTFLHIRMGSNWANDPNYPQMKREIALLFDELLAED